MAMAMAEMDSWTLGGSSWTLRFPRKLPLTKVSWEELTDILTNTNVAFTDIQTDTKVALTDILTDTNARCTKDEFIDIKANTNVAINNI